MATYATGVGITVGSSTFTVTNLTVNFSDVSGELDRIFHEIIETAS